jgi:hypothetical protein
VPARSRKQLLGCVARHIRNEARQSRRSLFARRRLHELGRGIFQPYAPHRGWSPSPYRRAVFASLCARGFMARRPSPDQLWRSGSRGFQVWRWRAGHLWISAGIGSAATRRHKPVLRRSGECASLRVASEQFPDATTYAFDKSISASAYPKHLQNLDCRLTLLLTPKECHNQKQRNHRNA